MGRQPMSETHDATDAGLDAGEFSEWVAGMTRALHGSAGTAVPCGDCVGCCSAHWPVALRAQDDAIARALPAHQLVEPNGSAGLRYMAPREDGTCPMLEARRCRVYPSRPQTCRDFDCRLFAAAGIASAGPHRASMDARIRRWRFRYASDESAAAHAAVRTTADLLVRLTSTPAGARLPRSPVALAGLAFKGHTALLRRTAGEDDDALLARVLATARAFDRSPDAA